MFPEIPSCSSLTLMTGSSSSASTSHKSILRIAKLCKHTTATIVAKLELSFKRNGAFKQWNLCFENTESPFNCTFGSDELCCFFFLQVMKDFVKESKDRISKDIQHLPTETYQQHHFQILSILCYFVRFWNELNLANVLQHQWLLNLHRIYWKKSFTVAKNFSIITSWRLDGIWMQSMAPITTANPAIS